MCVVSPGGGGGDGTLANQQSSHRRRSRRRRRRRQHEEQQQESRIMGAVDVAPAVASPIGSPWQARNLRYRTPQYLATLQVMAAAPSTTTATNNNNNKTTAATGGESVAGNSNKSDPTPTISAPPILINESYFCVSTTSGHVCIWTAQDILHCHSRRQAGTSAATTASIGDYFDVDNTAADEAPPVVSPTFVVDTSSSTVRGGQPTPSPLIVHLAPVPLAKTTTSLLTMAAVSELGWVHLININDDNKQGASLVGSFHTQKCGARCMTITQSGRVVIGYQSGYLEAWTTAKVPAATKNGPDGAVGKTPPPSSSTASEVDGIIHAKLLWRACFASHTLIRSVAQLKARHQLFNVSNTKKSSGLAVSDHHDKNDAMATINNNDNEARQSRDGRGEYGEEEYVALTLEHQRQQSTRSMLEVVNLESIEAAWNSLVSSSEGDFCSSSDLAVPLEEHWVLPEAGMELVDASSTLPPPPSYNNNSQANGTIPRKAHWIPSPGTDSLYELDHHLGDAAAAGNNASCAVGLSDGTVGILSAALHSNTNDGESNSNGAIFSWGIEKGVDQLLLSYPCIGMGAVTSDLHREDNHNNHPNQGGGVPHVAFCLRGGTTYLIPIIQNAEPPDNKATRPSSITVVSYPHDIDSDTTVQHLHGFRAGNLRYLRGKEHGGQSSKSSVPAFFYSWGGGIVDVYSCQTMTTKHEIDSIATLEEMVENGSANLLKNLLTSLDNSNLSLYDSTWQAAHDELDRLSPIATTRESISLDDILSDRLQNFRTVLLQLAEINDTEKDFVV